MQKKTIKPEMLAKFKAGEIYVDPQGDLQALSRFMVDIDVDAYLPTNGINTRQPYFGFHDGALFPTENRFRLPIIPLSEMYETAEDEFVMGEEVEIDGKLLVFYGCKLPDNHTGQKDGYKHITFTKDGWTKYASCVRRPIRKQTVSLEDLIATYAEKHGIAPEVITVDNN